MQLICADMPSVYSVSPKLNGPITGATDSKQTIFTFVPFSMRSRERFQDMGTCLITGHLFRTVDVPKTTSTAEWLRVPALLRAVQV